MLFLGVRLSVIASVVYGLMTFDPDCYNRQVVLCNETLLGILKVSGRVQTLDELLQDNHALSRKGIPLAQLTDVQVGLKKIDLQIYFLRMFLYLGAPKCLIGLQ